MTGHTTRVRHVRIRVVAVQEPNLCLTNSETIDFATIAGFH